MFSIRTTINAIPGKKNSDFNGYLSVIYCDRLLQLAIFNLDTVGEVVKCGGPL